MLQVPIVLHAFTTVVLVGIAAPAGAQQAPATAEPEAATSPALPEQQDSAATADAMDRLLPSPANVRPPLPLQAEGESVDYAYGAFQRGWYLTALALATPRAEAGDAAAQTLVGFLYETGLGIKQDKATAASWYDLATNAGDKRAAIRLGLMMLTGDGVPQD